MRLILLSIFILPLQLSAKPAEPCQAGQFTVSSEHEDLSSNIFNVINAPANPIHRYPQCIEELPSRLLDTTCRTYTDPILCLEGFDKYNFKSTPGILDKVASYDPDGVNECLFYKGTKIIKRPHPDHWAAIERKKDKIIEIANKLNIPPESIACSIGADATLTKSIWDRYSNQKSLKNQMPLQVSPSHRKTIL